MESPRTATSLQYWLLLAASLLTIKLLSYVADPDIAFFLGDSASYLNTALTYGIPSDRSYVYGLLVRIATLNLSSLNALVATQMLFSIGNCLILAYLLITFFRCSKAIATLAALFYAIEPIDTLFERYLMAEASSLLAFTLFITSLLFYLRHRDRRLLVLAALFGVGAAALRMAYLPAVALTGLTAAGWYALFGLRTGFTARSLAKRASHPILFVTVLTGLLALHDSVRPYSSSGFFLLAAWSPALDRDLVQQEPALYEVTSGLACNLRDEHQRLAELFLPDCLIDHVKHRYPDPREANAFAKHIAIETLTRHPLEVGLLGMHNWLAFWDPQSLPQILHYDTGADPIPKEFTTMVRNHFAIDITNWNQRSTPAKRYFQNATWWHRWVISSPLFLLLWWALTRRRYSPYSLLFSAASWALLLVITIPVVISSVRFFHGIAWLSFFPLATSLDGLIKAGRRWWQRGTPADPHARPTPHP